MDPHLLFIMDPQGEEMASAWRPLHIWLGSWASLSFAQGPASVDAKVKFSAQVFVEFSLLRMMPFPEDKCSFGLLHLLSDVLSLETLRENVFSQL